MTPAIFSLAGPALSEEQRAFFRDSDPAGYILFGRNIDSREQLRALTDDLRAIKGREKLFICIDQEGGRVARMKPPVWLAYPPGEMFDWLYDVAPISAIEAARVNAAALGLELAEAGITVDCHPSLDVRVDGAHDVIGDRALGREPMRVAALGRAILDGFACAGVAGCIKHMPGHGRSMADSHKELPRVTATAEELERDLAPFRTLADYPVGMTCHLVFEAWDGVRPATQSPTVIGEVIRSVIGFDGLLLTDDIDMQALDGSIPERSRKALDAGCDLVLNCWGRMDDMRGIAELCGTLSDKGTARLERALDATDLEKGDPARREELIAKRDALFAAAGVAA